jgi:outer membrane protein assembly factor BamB
MTDSELIQLVQEKAPEELSFDEIELLRERLKFSAELRDTLVGQLHMEEYISRALGRVAVSVDEIYATAVAQGAAGRQRLYSLLAWTLSLGLGIVVLLWLALGRDEKPPGGAPPAAAAADDKLPRIAALEPNGGRAKPQATSKASGEIVASADDSAPEPEKAATEAEKPVPYPAPQVAARDPAPETARAAPPGPAPVAGEWPELAPSAPRRALAEAAFEDIDGPLRGISKNQLSRWFAPVPGQNHNFTEANRGNIVVAGLDGLIRLRAPWPTDAVLSMAPFDHHGMAMHFWSGKTGVSLYYYQHPRPTWAAYRTSRKGPEARPSTFALVATDNDRYERSVPGAIEIRHHAGALVVSRGDLRLLTAPLDGPPAEVYVDKHAWLRSFTMYRGEPFPNDEQADALAASAKDSSPAALEWTKQLAKGVSLNKVGNGGMQLAADKGSDISWAAVKLPGRSLYEVVFRLGDMSPGTGVYLGDDAGKPLYVLGFVREQRTGQNVAAFVAPNAGAFETNLDINQQPVAFSDPGQWLRLVAGSGTLKCWTSGDGVRWSRAIDPARGLRGGWSHVGLISFKTNDPHQITIEALHISELAAISGLADEKLRRQVPAGVLTGDLHPGTWQTRVQESLPAGVDPLLWRNACALRTLAALPPANLGNALLAGLLDENLTRQASPADRLRVIDQAAELFDAWDQPDSYRLSQYYERLGKQLASEGDLAPWSHAGRGLLTAPIWTTAGFQTIPETLVSAELLFRIYADQPDQVRQLCRQLKLYNRPAIPEHNWPDSRQRLQPLVEWAGANAERALADKRRQNGNAPTAVLFDAQHPLTVSLSKEGFNTLAELEATLGDQSYRDACQIILGLKPQLALGLLPDGRDPRLMLSLPQAVDTAMRDYPGLRQTMVEQFGTLGRLRLQQALAEASPHLLQALAVQFFGTSSAATAHQWLGDRALADGDFAQAAAEFELALHSAEPEQKAPLAARLRLAGAMLGRDEGMPVTEPVVFNEAKLTADAFERLVAEMKSHAVAVGGAPLVAAEATPQGGIKAVRYDVQGRGTLAGDVGQNPGNPISGNVDWAARQYAGTVAGKMLYLSNRFQVSAFSLVNGKQHWSVPIGKDPAPTHSWGLVAMRPVVVGDRLFVRRLARNGPELVCFNDVNGKVRWTTHPSVSVASDPLLLQDRLYVFTLSTPLDNGLVTLELSLVNPLTGEILSQQPVIQLKNLWDRQINCQATVVGARFVAMAGGTVLCCDFTGRPLWVRRQLWIPPAQAPAGNEQAAGLPLVAGNRLFVTQPGVFAVECLDLDTGRRIWQQAIPDIRRLIGLAGQRVVVETARGWQAYAAPSGKFLWQNDAEQILDANVCPATGDLVVAHREPQANDTWRPVVVWINAETGREKSRLPLESLADKEPLLGPFVVAGDRLWTLFGRGLREPRREVYELIPTNDPAQPPRANVRN